MKKNFRLSLSAALMIFNAGAISASEAPPIIEMSNGQSYSIQPVLIHKDELGKIAHVEKIEDDQRSQVPTFSMNVGTPHGAYIAVGIVVGKSDCSGSLGGGFAYGACVDEGVLFELAPGTNGGSASIGYEQRLLGLGFPVGLIHGAWAVKGTAFQSWSEIDRAMSAVPAGLTYLGVEADLSVEFVRLSFGVLKQVIGNRPEFDTINKFSLGVGF